MEARNAAPAASAGVTHNLGAAETKAEEVEVTLAEASDKDKAEGSSSTSVNEIPSLSSAAETKPEGVKLDPFTGATSKAVTGAEAQTKGLDLAVADATVKTKAVEVIVAEVADKAEGEGPSTTDVNTAQSLSSSFVERKVERVQPNSDAGAKGPTKEVHVAVPDDTVVIKPVVMTVGEGTDKAKDEGPSKTSVNELSSLSSFVERKAEGVTPNPDAEAKAVTAAKAQTKSLDVAVADATAVAKPVDVTAAKAVYKEMDEGPSATKDIPSSLSFVERKAEGGKPNPDAGAKAQTKGGDVAVGDATVAAKSVEVDVAEVGDKAEDEHLLTASVSGNSCSSSSVEAKVEVAKDTPVDVPVSKAAGVIPKPGALAEDEPANLAGAKVAVMTTEVDNSAKVESASTTSVNENSPSSSTMETKPEGRPITQPEVSVAKDVPVTADLADSNDVDVATNVAKVQATVVDKDVNVVTSVNDNTPSSSSSFVTKVEGVRPSPPLEAGALAKAVHVARAQVEVKAVDMSVAEIDDRDKFEEIGQTSSVANVNDDPRTSSSVQAIPKATISIISNKVEDNSTEGESEIPDSAAQTAVESSVEKAVDMTVTEAIMRSVEDMADEKLHIPLKVVAMEPALASSHVGPGDLKEIAKAPSVDVHNTNGSYAVAQMLPETKGTDTEAKLDKSLAANEGLPMKEITKECGEISIAKTAEKCAQAISHPAAGASVDANSRLTTITSAEESTKLSAEGPVVTTIQASAQNLSNTSLEPGLDAKNIDAHVNLAAPANPKDGASSTGGAVVKSVHPQAQEPKAVDEDPATHKRTESEAKGKNISALAAKLGGTALPMRFGPRPPFGAQPKASEDYGESKVPAPAEISNQAALDKPVNKKKRPPNRQTIASKVAENFSPVEDVRPEVVGDSKVADITKVVDKAEGAKLAPTVRDESAGGAVVEVTNDQASTKCGCCVQ